MNYSSPKNQYESSPERKKFSQPKEGKRSPADSRDRLPPKPPNRFRAQAPVRPEAEEDMRELKTLERVISKAGVASRTEARTWIGSGRVQVNGKLVQTPDQWVDLNTDTVTLDGKPLQPQKKMYLLLYKPKGFITTYKDPEGRPTVYDLMHDLGQWVFPVGRLDLETSGLLLLTNDTQLAELITNPEHKVAKTYLVKSSKLLSDDQLELLRNGIALNDGPTRPAVVRRVRDSEKYTFFEITITEGRNRQVRRMVEALEAKVLKLVRTSIGALEISGLEMGKYRHLTNREVEALRQ